MVYIKNIKMTGFKSFGNTTTDVKLSPGFTCIVGPNGSGKSNAIDAINFCLGTLSKKAMRAERLTDLLFNGIKGKDQAKSTIVEIELDNSDLKIPVEDKKVVISRELRRNGSGVYRLNGKRTTRMDILDKLRIAGIDCVDGFNIIQQGQIGEIVGMSNIQRRELLEGVSGIGQFEDKKEAAIAELDEAQRKMGELNLLINELSTRVVQLKKEKKSAEKWVELGHKVKKLRSELLSLQLYSIKNEIVVLTETIEKQNKEINELENQKQGLDELKKLEEEVKAKQEMTLKLEQKQSEILKKINNTKIELAKLEQLSEFKKTNKEQKEQELRTNKRDKLLTTASIDEKQNEIQKIIKRLQKIDNEKDDLIHRRLQIKKDIMDRETEFKEVQEEYERIVKRIQNFNEDITSHEVIKDISTSIIQGLEQAKISKTNQILEIEKRKETTKTKIRAVQNEIDKESSKLEELKEKIATYNEKTTYHNEKITEIEIKSQNVSKENLVLKTKIEMIKTNISEDETDKVTKYILENKKEFPGILNTLGTILGGEEAIPRSIRHLKNTIVAEDLISCLKCIRKLKEDLIGACIFIPIKNMGIQYQDIASELEKKVTSSVILVEDIDQALELRKQNNNVQVQTVAGDIFYPNGLINGGFHISAAVNHLEPLIKLQKSKEEDIVQLVKEKTIQESFKVQINKAKEISKESGLNIEKKIRDGIIQFQHLKDKHNQEETELKKSKDEMNEIEKDHIEKKIELDKINREIDEYQISKSQIERKLKEVRNNMENLNVSELKEQFSLLNEKINENEKEKIRTEERKNGFEKLIIPSGQRINQLEIKEKEIEDEIKEIKENNKEVTNGIKDSIEMIWKTEQKLQEIMITIKENQYEIAELGREIKRYHRKNSKIEKEIQASKEKITEIKIKRAKLDTECESLINKIREEELEILKIDEKFLSRINLKKHRIEIENISKSRKSLEPINMRSIESFKTQYKRLNETEEIKKVLLEERKVILDVIAQLEIEKINTFMSAFNRINLAFKEIFLELANGEARLILENPEEIFEGGVSIEAHPDGKTLKTLESMSGGEKALTALAFIFAIQQSEPQPFYVLDEIDATLDVKNVDKVGRLLAKMAKGTSDFGHAQFIVISHRDILMAKSETIYGTTNVNGITKIMELQLDEKGLIAT